MTSLMSSNSSKNDFYKSGKHHFEVTRPHRVSDSKQSTGYRLASLQDKLSSKGSDVIAYNFFRSNADSLDEFGLGVSLYFKTLKAFGVIFLVCALISIIAMNENYEYQDNYSGLLIPPDPDCDEASPDHADNNGEFHPPRVDTPTRLLGSVYGVTRAELEFSSQGVADIILVAFLFFMVVISAYFEKQEVIRSDTNQQTMRDYTVMIVNPPADVNDTQAYYDHFRQFGEVVLISIIPRNGSLLKDIASKVVKEKQLESLVESNDGENGAAPEWVKGLIRSVRGKGPLRHIFPSRDSLKSDINLLSQKIKSGAESDSFPPWRVFVSFNTETACKNCFSVMSSHKFMGSKLIGKEAPEPSELIYENNDMKIGIAFGRNILSYVLALVVVILSYIIIFFLHQVQGNGIALVVTCFIVLINAVA